MNAHWRKTTRHGQNTGPTHVNVAFQTTTNCFKSNEWTVSTSRTNESWQLKCLKDKFFLIFLCTLNLKLLGKKTKTSLKQHFFSVSMWQSVLWYFWKKANILGLFKQRCFSLLPASTVCTSVSRWLPVFLLGLFLTDVDEIAWSLRLARHVSLEISVNGVLQFAVEGLVQQTSEAVQAVRVVGQTEFTGGHKQSKTPELLKFGSIYEIQLSFNCDT